MKTQSSDSRFKKVLYTFSSLNDLGQVITSDGSVEEMAKSGLYLILGTLSASQGAIFQYSASRSRLEILAAKGLEETPDLSLPLADGDLQRLVLAPHVVTAGNGSAPLHSFFSDDRDLLEGIHTALLSPLRVGEELVGLLCVGEHFGGGEYSEEDRQVLAMMSRQLSVALHNHKLFARLEKKVEENRTLYENLRQIYQETIQAFATAIDAKDDYTQGHSARVAQYAVAIGEGMGLAGDEIEGLRLAGLLHDIGKITVDSSIIRKTSSLNEEEIMEMHRHPAIGHEILSNIKFPWGDLSTLARHHHEKVDGQGYPDGLRGEDLQQGARIISLADSFDAMTSDRPYRGQIGLEDTLREVRRCMGTQFDSGIADVLFQVLEKELTGVQPAPRILPCLNMHYDRGSVLKVLQEVRQTAESRPTDRNWAEGPSVQPSPYPIQ